jgi:hypothetical protein
MADKVRVVLNSAGVREMLLSNEMMAICKEAAQTIQGNYGKDTVLDEYRGKNRVNVSVIADYGEASENNDLLKAVHE